jgi:hypothetical protein
MTWLQILILIGWSVFIAAVDDQVARPRDDIEDALRQSIKEAGHKADSCCRGF